MSDRENPEVAEESEDGPVVHRTAPPIGEIAVGDLLPIRTHQPTNVSLFMYNAAVWNHHRIHYDETYATKVEGHAGIVVDGPLQGDWISQVALNWIGHNDHLVRFSYSNRLAAYLGETLTSGGQVLSVDVSSGLVELSLVVQNADGDVTTPGRATVHLAS